MITNGNNAVAFPPSAMPPVPAVLTTGEQAFLDSSKNSVINFVVDCGADPTGVADCAPAFDIAFAKLSAITAHRPTQSVRLFIPPGTYALKSSPVTPTWSFAGLASSLAIQGAGIDNTIITLQGFDPPALANLYTCIVSDLTLLGIGNGGPNDSVLGWSMQTVYKLAAFHRVHCMNVKAQNTALYIAIAQTLAVFSECVFTCCSSQTAGWGTATIDTYTNAHVEDCVWTDVGNVNGISENGAKLAGNQAWMQFNNTVSGGVYTVLRNCFFDENCVRNVYFKGTAATMTNIVLENVFCNPPAQAPESACVQIDHADSVTINGLVDSGLAHFSSAPALVLTSVGECRVRKLHVDTTSPSKSVTADASCGYLEIEASDNNDVDVTSSAKITVVKVGGVAYDLYASNATIVANQLCKMGASGAVPIATTDGSSVVVGAARQSAAAAGKVSLSRPGQVVPMLNDNNAAIAEGDQVIISASSAGRIRTGTTAGKGVGVAVTGSSGVDAVTYVRVAPF